MLLRCLLSLFLIFISIGCVSILKKNPYENSTPAQLVTYKRERLPFPTNTKFVISQGAFGSKSHIEPGNEYSWDFDVPYGTPVVSVENGVVLEVWKPNGGGGCDKKYLDIKRAYEVIRKTDHYTWIYKQVLAHEAELGVLIKRHRLVFSPATEVFVSNFPRVTAEVQKSNNNAVSGGIQMDPSSKADILDEFSNTIGPF